MTTVGRVLTKRLRMPPGRLALVAVGALAGVFGAAGVALAETVVTGGGEVAPSTLPAERYAPVSLHVQIQASTDEPSGVPDRISKIELNFDDDGRITTRGLPTCKPAKIRHATIQLARQECRRARVGGGDATVVIPVGQGHVAEHATVNVFNGTRRNGNPTVLFHARADFGYTQLMVGTVRGSTAGPDFGKALVTPIQPIQLNAVLRDFEVTVRKTWKHRGQRRSYISARCNDPDRTLNVHAEFELGGGAQTQTGDVAQTCTVKG
jgi:hypothetical protein